MPRRAEASATTAKVGARIRELRLSRNLSLGDLADGSDLSKGHLSSIEHGLAAITAETVERIAKGLGMPALYVYTFIEEDERAKIVDLILDFPAKELVALRKELTAKKKIFAAQSPEPKGKKGGPRREG